MGGTYLSNLKKETFFRFTNFKGNRKNWESYQFVLMITYVVWPTVFLPDAHKTILGKITFLIQIRLDRWTFSAFFRENRKLIPTCLTLCGVERTFDGFFFPSNGSVINRTPILYI